MSIDERNKVIEFYMAEENCIFGDSVHNTELQHRLP